MTATTSLPSIVLLCTGETVTQSSSVALYGASYMFAVIKVLNTNWQTAKVFTPLYNSQRLHNHNVPSNRSDVTLSVKNAFFNKINPGNWNRQQL